ncbi:hypothetical protein KY312_02530, partial [Candidatus Woesearchaeota archaeon]|nr:hypothetical protein [Candidatus Woesearchaeota archaeon]
EYNHVHWYSITMGVAHQTELQGKGLASEAVAKWAQELESSYPGAVVSTIALNPITQHFMETHFAAKVATQEQYDHIMRDLHVRLGALENVFIGTVSTSTYPQKIVELGEQLQSIVEQSRQMPDDERREFRFNGIVQAMKEVDGPQETRQLLDYLKDKNYQDTAYYVLGFVGNSLTLARPYVRSIKEIDEKFKEYSDLLEYHVQIHEFFRSLESNQYARILQQQGGMQGATNIIIQHASEFAQEQIQAESTVQPDGSIRLTARMLDLINKIKALPNSIMFAPWVHELNLAKPSGYAQSLTENEIDQLETGEISLGFENVMGIADAVGPAVVSGVSQVDNNILAAFSPMTIAGIPIVESTQPLSDGAHVVQDINGNWIVEIDRGRLSGMVSSLTLFEQTAALRLIIGHEVAEARARSQGNTIADSHQAAQLVEAEILNQQGLTEQQEFNIKQVTWAVREMDLFSEPEPLYPTVQDLLKTPAPQIVSRVKISEGDLGEIYRVRDSQGNVFIEKVAKEFSGEAYIENEAEILAYLTKNNIQGCCAPEYIGVGTTETGIRLYMSEVQNAVSLGDIIYGDVTGIEISQQAWSNFRTLMQNLDFLGIIHSDLYYLNNILVNTQTGQVFIIDFGMSINPLQTLEIARDEQGFLTRTPYTLSTKYEGEFFDLIKQELGVEYSDGDRLTELQYLEFIEKILVAKGLIEAEVPAITGQAVAETSPFVQSLIDKFSGLVEAFT